MLHRACLWHLLLVAASASPADAQNPKPSRADGVTDAPAPTYRSAFDGSRGEESAPIDWRAANDEVARIGGWRAYLRESRGAAEKAADPSKRAVPDKPAADSRKPASPSAHKH